MNEILNVWFHVNKCLWQEIFQTCSNQNCSTCFHHSLKGRVSHILRIVIHVSRLMQDSNIWPTMPSSAQYDHKTWRNFWKKFSFKQNKSSLSASNNLYAEHGLMSQFFFFLALDYARPRKQARLFHTWI
jgi:hypothetical protein